MCFRKERLELMKNSNKHSGKEGFGLLEVLIAALIIAIMIIGGSATMYQTGSNIVVQGHRRVALQLANQRLEHARKQYYYSIVPPTYFEEKGDIYYLTENATDAYKLDLNNALQTETYTLDSIDYTMTTQILRRNSVFAPECLEIRVEVVYRPSTGEKVEMSTLILPPEVSN